MQILRTFFCGIDRKDTPTAPIVKVDMPSPDGPRHYLKAVPTQSVVGKRPLIIVLHGSGASAAQVLGMAFPPSPLSVWLEIAEREQLVVVAPDGTKRRGQRAWNDGFAAIASNPKVDDVGFINAIIDRAIAEDDVDPERVYVIGVSKGGMMAYRLAAELAPRLAAFSAVLAGMPVEAAYPPPAIPLSALIVASTADPFIPYSGGKSPYTLWFLAPMLGIETTAAIWRELAGLTKMADISPVATPQSHPTTRAIRYTWRANSSTRQVRLVKIEGGGHAEPSGKKRYPCIFNRFPGRQNADLEIAEEAWSFFKEKRLSAGPA
ncbi:alpha/beta hydrolase family esterase [Pseudoduganella namucuonensis]|nr:PHB depolymerase family esterase [Pseudoduganella namucuonensis]